MNRLYLVGALLPGEFMSDNYLILAKSETDVKQKLNAKFPNCNIRSINELKDNECLIFAGNARCEDYGYGVDEPHNLRQIY